MTYPDAPYHADVASGPPHGRAHWVTTADGLRIRVAVWPEGAKGTILIVPGRTEYIEKYSDVVRRMSLRGYGAAVIDLRGQGLSPRPAHDRRVGHVDRFDQFQHDFDAMVDLCTALDMPRPWHILGHSMGGLIALRAALRRPNILRRAVFSAPMWGLQLPFHRRAVGWTVSALASGLGLGKRAAPQSGKVADPTAAPFEGNLLTRDADTFAWMQHQISTYPDLALGGPSLGWVWAAFREMHTCARLAAPNMPALTYLGTEEAIVSADAIHVRMASWPEGTLETVAGARHEVLMESAAVTDPIFDRIAAHLAS